MRAERPIIRKHVSVDDLLAGLAEEAAELAQAALKLRRCYVGTNPTPMDSEEAYDNLMEEIADVKLYLKMLDINQHVVNNFMNAKGARWVKRLEG